MLRQFSRKNLWTTAASRAAGAPSSSIAEAPFVVRVEAGGRAPRLGVAVVNPKQPGLEFFREETDRLLIGAGWTASWERSAPVAVGSQLPLSPTIVKEVLASLASLPDNIPVVVNKSHLSPSHRFMLSEAWGGRPVLDRCDLLLAFGQAHVYSSFGKLQLALTEALRRKADAEAGFLRHTSGALAAVEHPAALRRNTSEHTVVLRRKLEAAADRQPILGGRAGPLVTVVGYHHAGKTNMVHALCGAPAAGTPACAFDPTTRTLRLPGGLTVAIADTVGFVGDMPPEFLPAMQISLQRKVETADLLVVVRPVAGVHQPHIVHEMLTKSLQLKLPLHRLEVVVTDGSPVAPARVADPSRVYVDLNSPADCARLAGTLEQLLTKSTAHVKVEVRVPSDDTEQLSWLYRNADVVSTKGAADGSFTSVVALMDETAKRRFEGHFGSPTSRVAVPPPSNSPSHVRRDRAGETHHTTRRFFDRTSDDDRP